MRALVAAVERAGAARETFLRAIALGEADLVRSDARFPAATVLAFCEQALRVSRDPALGLHWGCDFDPRDFGPSSSLPYQADTLRHGLELAEHYGRLLHDCRSYELLEDARGDSIRATTRASCSAGAARFRVEILFARTLKLIRHVAPRATPVAVRFAYPAPSHQSEYERVFGPVVEFDQPHTEMVFARGLFDTPSRHFDHEVHAALTSLAEQRLHRSARRAARAAKHVPWATRIRRYLLERAPSRLTMTATARAFGQSARTLRRLLAAEATTYRDVEYAVLAAHAGSLLRDDGLSIQETAREMGFTEVGSFHRAFKTWAGVTPNEYRHPDNAPHVARANG